MSDLPDGKYAIVSSVDPNPRIGADKCDSCTVKPVITDGEIQAWTVRKVGDTYELVLEGDWYASSEGDKVVVKLGGPIPPPVVIFWKLIRVGEVSIKSTDSNKAWTVETRDSKVVPKSQVFLQFLTAPVNDDQIFNFVPIL